MVNCTGCLRGVVERLKRKGAIKNLHDFLNNYEVLSGNSGHAQTEMLSITKNRLHFIGATGRFAGIVARYASAININ